MLTLVVGEDEIFNDETQEFSQAGGFKIELEHSLFSISKWESKWKKPFLVPGAKSTEEALSYVECMILNGDFSPEEISQLNGEHSGQIADYINDPQTATWFREIKTSKTDPQGPVLTNELIYFWMIEASIPFECQYWHLNRLFTLIRVIGAQRAAKKPAGKPSRNDLADRRALNEQRRAEFGTKG